MKTTIQPILTVHLNHIKDNYKELCHMAAPAKVAAVVKDDSYGLGAKQVVQTLYPTCRTFFVAYAFEGALIRPFAPEADIYILQGIGQEDIECVRTNRLIPVLSSLEDIKWWEQLNISDIRPAVQMDTGLNRLGLRAQDLALLPPAQRNHFSLFMSHLACADTPDHPMNGRQQRSFDDGRELFQHTPYSLSASGGTLLGPDFTYDIVRTGALLYGITRPQTGVPALKSAITIRATVLQTATIQPCESISYGATFTADRPMKIAVVSIGYGDGLFVSLSNKGCFWSNARRLPILGRVCMDSTMCDITDCPEITAGDTVDVLNDSYTPDEMALDAGTHGYEILSRFGKGTRFIKNNITA